MAVYLDYTRNLGTPYQDQNDPHSQAAMEIRNAASTAFREMADRSYTTLRFTADGFVMDNKMTFK